MRNFWNTPQKSKEGLVKISTEFYSDDEVIYHLVNELLYPVTTADDIDFIDKISEVEEQLQEEN